MGSAGGDFGLPKKPEGDRRSAVRVSLEKTDGKGRGKRPSVVSMRVYPYDGVSCHSEGQFGLDFRYIITMPVREATRLRDELARLIGSQETKDDDR